MEFYFSQFGENSFGSYLKIKDPSDRPLCAKWSDRSVGTLIATKLKDVSLISNTLKNRVANRK